MNFYLIAKSDYSFHAVCSVYGIYGSVPQINIVILYGYIWVLGKAMPYHHIQLCANFVSTWVMVMCLQAFGQMVYLRVFYI